MPPFAPKPLIVTVLPPREGFGPGRTGAIGLIAHRLNVPAEDNPFRTLIIGGTQAEEVFEDIPFTAVVPPWWRVGNVNLRYAVGVAALLRRLSPALVEVHNRPEIALSLAARLAPIPVSLMLHNDPQTMRGAKSVAGRRNLLARLARVLPVSGYLRARLLDGVADPAHAPETLPNCIDLAALPPSRAAWEREKTILFVGRVVPEKAPDAFVAACARALPQLPGWRAEIIGADRFRADSPETGFSRDVAAAAAAAGVAMAGYLDHPGVSQALASAAMVVMPSRWQEPFGLTALEAMASGACLLCSTRGGLPEVGGDVFIPVDPDDPQGMAETIVALAQDPPCIAKLSLAGRERARKFDVGPARRRLDTIRLAILAGG